MRTCTDTKATHRVNVRRHPRPVGIHRFSVGIDYHRWRCRSWVIDISSHRSQIYIPPATLSLPLPMFPLKFPSALVALFLVASMRPETNVTIDDTESRIVYHPPIVWSYQGNVRSLQFSRTPNTHFYGRRPAHKIEGIRRRTTHPRSGQQHLSPSPLSAFVHLSLGLR